MPLDHIAAGKPFFAHNCGVGLAPETTCLHGEPAFSLHLLGTYSGAAAHANDAQLHVLLPRCVAAQVVGALTAFIANTEGLAASEAFMDAARGTFHTTLQELSDVVAQGRDCCEAAFRTGGREHTCSRTTRP